jgi:hypothetical protein
MRTIRVSWPVWNWLFSTAFYIVGSILLWEDREPESAGIFLVVQLFVLPFIWFPSYFGEWIGIPPFGTGPGDRPIDQESPPFLVLLFGWLIMVSHFLLAYFWV